jgi:hypothetical protein
VSAAATILVLARWPHDSRSHQARKLLSAGLASTRVQQAEELLSHGLFHEARAEALAVERLDLTGPERLKLDQLRREASVLADLSAASLAQIVHIAAGLPASEWQAVFHSRYRGQSVVFDLEIRRTADGHYQHTARFLLVGEDARLDLDNLSVLQSLPLDEPHRLLLGGRLDVIQRTPRGGWVIRLAGDSGVLLTNAGAAGMCCPALRDAEARQVLDQQHDWVLGARGAGLVKKK